MNLREDFLKQVGEVSLPKIVAEEFLDTWLTYETNASSDRVLSVLGFMYLMRQAGLRRKLTLKTDPSVFYKKLREEEFKTDTDLIARQLVSYRIFDVLRLYKSKFTKVLPIRGEQRVFRFDLCLEPKRKEALDSAIAKLNGLLYTGTLPKQLQEVWRKLPTKATPKSALPKCNVLIGTESTLGFLPMMAKPKFAIFSRRAADDILILRIILNVDLQPVPWLSDRKQDDLLKSLILKAFSKLKG